jgi:hypothetical protein
MFIDNYISAKECLSGLQSKCAVNDKLFNKYKMKSIKKMGENVPKKYP